MTDYINLSDQQLIALARERDKAAFSEIYHRYWSLMYAHAIKMLNDEDDARDVVQELFIGFWTKIDQMKSDANLSGFLYVSIKHKIFDLIDQKKVRRDYLRSIDSFIDLQQNQILAAITEKELQEALDLEIEQLPAKMKAIFKMRVKDNKTYKEIAEELNISDKTVKKQINNAVNIIKPKLGKLSGWSGLIYFLMK